MNQEIITKEVEHTPDDRMVVHLYQEGAFYRAYEWSAWLAHRFIKDFKVTHKKMKGVENSVTYIGFPATSLEKYTPENATVEIIGEKSIDLFLSKEMIPDEMSMEIMSTDFYAWKDSVPLTEFQQKPKKESAHENHSLPPSTLRADNLSITGIMQKILAFPIENNMTQGRFFCHEKLQGIVYKLDVLNALLLLLW